MINRVGVDITNTSPAPEMVPGAQATNSGPVRRVGGVGSLNGSVALVAGSRLVSSSIVTLSSLIFLTSQQDGGTPGWLRVSARVPGKSFTITSSSAADTSTVAYEIVEP